MRYRADIDGLRAVAVLLVVLFHSGLVGLHGGFVGVDVFFVISGYLICSIIVDELSRGDFSIARFYERRCRRILPALLVMFALTAVAATFVLLPMDLKEFSDSLIASTLFVSNVYFWQHTGYFDGTADFKPLLHTWSLSVEEQFYIVTPLLLWGTARFFKRRYATLLLPLALLSLAVSVWGVEKAPNAAFYVLPTRFWELLVGALLAVSAPKPLTHPRLANLCAGLGLAMIAGAAVLFSDATPFPGLSALVPCLGAALIIYTGLGTRTFVSRLLSTAPMVFVGAISYSLYLWHWPLFSLYRYHVSRQLLPLEALILVGLSSICAVASYHLVEQPFRRRAEPLTRRAVFAGTALGMLAMLGVAAPASLTNGLTFRFPQFRLEAIPGPERYNEGTCFLDDDQTPADWQPDACFITRGRGPRVLLWGDSFAAQYVPGIIDNAESLNADVLQYTQSLCPPIFGFENAARPSCKAFNDDAPRLIQELEIEAVVMAARWDYAFKRHVDPAQITHTIARIQELGADVYVIGQSPLFGNNVQTLFAKSGLAAGADRAASPIAFPADTNARLRQAAGTATFVDPIAALCDDLDCPYREDGRFLMWDNGHFSEHGSRIAVMRYFPFVSRRVDALGAAHVRDL